MACLQIYRELLSLTTFLRVHWNSKEVSYLSWQNTYPNLKTTCLIKLRFFLWTKLLENLLLAKYLISVAAPLIINKWHNLCAIIIFDSSGLTRLILHLVFCFFFLVLFTAIKIVVFKVNTYVYPLGMLRSNFS